MGGLEAALAATEERVDAALKATAVVTRELKKAKTGAERGQLRDLRRALGAATALAGDAAQATEGAGESFGFDEQAHLESGSYTQELLEAAAAQDVAMFEADERLLYYPSLIKVLPADAAVVGRQTPREASAPIGTGGAACGHAGTATAVPAQAVPGEP